jgi:rhodanese-related sulfurtransferase
MPQKRKSGAAKKQIKKQRSTKNMTGFTGKYSLALIIAGAAVIMVALHFALNAFVPVLLDPGTWQSMEKALKIPTGKDAIPHIKLEEAYDIFQKGRAVFIDARGGNEYEEAHIKGAISIPAGSPSEAIAKFKDVLAGKLLVTYCHGVGCHLSDKTAFALYDAGYRKIKIFFGGWNDWTRAGYPLDKYEPPEQYKHLFNDITDGQEPGKPG